MVTCEPNGDSAFSNVIQAVVDENHLSREADSHRPILEAENVNSDDIATILYTSGTTGLN
jgi:long-subunit acyl-CoA synthetase (AMP-forming)